MKSLGYFYQMESNHPVRWLDQIHADLSLLYSKIREGEHQRQDFKFRIDSSEKIAKTLAAFANTDGGRILIGVKDNGKIAGIDPEEEYYMIEGASSLHCKPKVEFSCKVYEDEKGKKVLEINIEPSEEKPHTCLNEKGNWRSYIRQEDEIFETNRVIHTYIRHKSSKLKRKNFIEYGPEEKALFSYLSENPFISISKFCRLASIPFKKAERILVLFLQWGVIEFEATQNGIIFKLKEEG